MAGMCSIEVDNKETVARCSRCGTRIMVSQTSLLALLAKLLADIEALKSALRDREKHITYYRDNFELPQQQER
jgi:hypothetical protein